MFDFLELLKLWPKIIGLRTAKVTEPIRISSKKLIIYTAHSAFSQQLSLMQGQILEKIGEHYPKSKHHIKSLSFVTKDIHFSEKKTDLLSGKETKKYMKNNRLNKYSPTYRNLFNEASKLFEDIENHEVKESLIKIYITSKNL